MATRDTYRTNNNYANGFSDNKSLFEKTFNAPKAVKRRFAFDSIWQTIEPEATLKYTNCPDCGGVGDLSRVRIGRSV